VGNAADTSITGKENRVLNFNEKKVDEAVLAVLWLTLHEECRAWKGIDWAAMNRLYEKGLISDPALRAKSVVFTEEGLAEARRLAEKMFT
jgi:hypothetical protein